MKRILVIASLFAAANGIQAQSVQEGNNHLYYERYQSAENTFSQLTKADPSNAEAWLGLTKTYMLTDKDSAANAALATAPASVQEQPLFEVAQGWSLLAAGGNNAATPWFQKALEQTREKDPQVLSAVAQAHIDAKTGNAQYAVDLLTKAIKRDKHNAALYVTLGDAYRKMTNGSEAYQAYKKAIERNDKYAAAYHSMGQIFQTQKNAEMYLDYFGKAIAADPAYAPSLYSLYLYQYYRDAARAMDYYNQYLAHSDQSVQNDYDLTDLLFLNKDYNAAIQKAKAIEQKEGAAFQPRLYKLIGYSYAGMKDTAQAITYMQQYFKTAPDSLLIARDYETASQLYASKSNDSLATLYLVKSTERETDSLRLVTNYKELADIAKQENNHSEQAKWLGLYYAANKKANNLDLYYWGLAHYLSENYAKADSVFGIYAVKYPEQSFGYYWQAKSQALLDSGMQDGLAIPTYHKLIDVLSKDTADANYKKWMVEAYGYLAAYEANKEKDYKEALDYFGKMLDVDPDNEDAKKYTAILEKQVKK
jgi:tetratricopeptide (TPR) repeat protein